MAELRAAPSRLLPVAVWGSGALLAVSLVLVHTGWGDGIDARLANDLAYVPVTLLTAALGLRLITKGGLGTRERRAWLLLEASFVCQGVARVISVIRDLMSVPPSYPSVADYLYLSAIPFIVAGLLLFPAARRTRGERVKLLIDSLIVVAGACMALWYLEIGPIVEARGVDPFVIAFSAAVPILDLLLLFALITLLLRRPETGAGIGLLCAAFTLNVVADSTYTIAFVQFGIFFRPGSWPFLLWAAGSFLTLLAVHRRTVNGRSTPQPYARRAEPRRRLSWLPYGAVALAYGMLAFVARDQPPYPLGGMIAGAVALTLLVIVRQVFAQRENRRLAVTDPLTGLANRALIAERVAEFERQPARDERHDAVLLIDLDHFKPINDAHGHDAGDAVLRAVAEALRSVLRAGDTAGRLGGDEFAVLLCGLPDRAAVGHVAQRLVEALRTPVIFNDLVLQVEASIGVAFRAQGDALLARADVAMYAAKRSGRGRYRVYEPSMDANVLDAELRRAVARDELVVHFQPVADLAGGGYVAVEALVRWNHPVRGLLLPGAFIEQAEETGAVIPLGEWVLREACRQAAGWPVRLSVNLSARQVVQLGLVGTIRGILDETGFPADRLVLELTESVVLRPDEQTVARLHELRDLGIGIAIDDFGTGYAALSYLRTLPVSILKVDRSFVADIDTDPDAYAVAAAVVGLAQAYRLQVVAEGVETAAQVRCLTEIGCGYGQGYLFSRPVPGTSLRFPVTQITCNAGPVNVDKRAGEAPCESVEHL